MNDSLSYNDDIDCEEEDSELMVTILKTGTGLSPVKIPQCLLDLLDGAEYVDIVSTNLPETEFNFLDSLEEDNCIARNSETSEQLEEVETTTSTNEYPPDFDESDDEQLTHEQLEATIRGLESGTFRAFLGDEGVDLEATLDIIECLPKQECKHFIEALSKAERGDPRRLKKQCRKLKKRTKK